jgi:hypothetical protein
MLSVPKDILRYLLISLAPSDLASMRLTCRQIALISGINEARFYRSYWKNRFGSDLFNYVDRLVPTWRYASWYSLVGRQYQRLEQLVPIFNRIRFDSITVEIEFLNEDNFICALIPFSIVNENREGVQIYYRKDLAGEYDPDRGIYTDYSLSEILIDFFLTEGSIIRRERRRLYSILGLPVIEYFFPEPEYLKFSIYHSNQRCMFEVKLRPEIRYCPYGWTCSECHQILKEKTRESF